MHTSQAKPFVKWAGGKTQLLKEIAQIIPKKFESIEFTYVEPFVGGGAVLFWILNNYPNIKKAIINDINSDLINTYKVIQSNVDSLIDLLKKWEKEFFYLENNDEKKKEYYYNKRDLFNSRQSDNITQAALFIFLNKTCFNGLYRVNKKNEFNVPIGKYKKPIICDENNLRAVNRILQKVIILNRDFEETINYAEGETLFYLDPPYKPLNKTSNFTSYSNNDFDDKEQFRLAQFCRRLNQHGYYWILSNSDPKNQDPENNFFDNLYQDFNIKRIYAKRSINSKGEKRGKLTELLITNFAYEKTMSIAQ